MEIKEIFKHWKSTFSNSNCDAIEPCFQQIISAYSEENRHYHNVEHLSNLLEQIVLLKLQKEERNILIYTTLLHDVIYEAGSNSNEEKSAEFAFNSLSKLGLNKGLISKVCEIIIATSNHESNSKLTQLFLDMDLSILGANQETYYNYTAQIKREHERIPTVLYKIGRKRFLRSMLSKPFIFSTNLYRDRLETQARINLSNELKTL
jgi:predicted metal-dependent HD superfamily phosphohydrolase